MRDRSSHDRRVDAGSTEVIRDADGANATGGCRA